MNKFDKWIFKNRWVLAPLLYVTVCVWTYFGVALEVDGIAVPRQEAGMWGLIGLHAMMLLAIAGAWLLHKTVNIIVKIRDYFKGKKK